MQDELDLGWLDYGARMYDGAIGRFFTADPLSEEYYAWTPYHYTMNNPINSIDPNGKEVYYLNGEDAEKVMRDLNVIFRKTYNLDYDVFSMETRTVKVKKEIEKDVDFDLFDTDTWDGKTTETVTVKEQRTYIKTNNESGFDWSQDKYASATFDVFNTKMEFKGAIVSENTKIPADYFGRTIGQADGYSFKDQNLYWTSSHLKPENPNGASFKRSHGGVTLHELVHHFHPLGNTEGSSGLQGHFNIPFSNDHGGGVKTNWSDKEKARLKVLRDRTGKP